MKRGWCPTASRPMMSGDGLIVRLRPTGGRLTADQAQAVAEASRRYGNERMDLTSRASLQLRGVTDHPALIAALAEVGLGDGQPILSSPFAPDPWEAMVLPPLPPKFGIVLDRDGWLRDVPGDIRVETSAEGRTIIRADGQPLGREGGPDLVRAMADWFLSVGTGRMRDHVPPPHLAGDTAPQPARAEPPLGLRPDGALVGLPFGELTADTLGSLGPVTLTPWRALFLPGAMALPDLITDSADPLRRVTACPGAPACAQGMQPTRPLARRLARHVTALHVSGCAKGCANPRIAAPTLVATERGFDLIPHGLASDPPVRRGLTEAECAAYFGDDDAPV